MEKIMHLAAQYLATAAISFVEKKDDDSHTNLGWVNHCLVTHSLGNGAQLALDYRSFSLVWKTSNEEREGFQLNGRTHKEIIDWLKSTSACHISDKRYTYNLHYDLPYDPIKDNFRFELANQPQLDQLIKNRDLAQTVFTQLLARNNFESEIRIWPHHFDTGAFVRINDALSIGMGMAMPDGMIDDFYFYMSGYNGHDPIKFDEDTKKGLNSYYDGNWKGFAKAISVLDEIRAINFCEEAIAFYLKQ